MKRFVLNALGVLLLGVYLYRMRDAVTNIVAVFVYVAVFSLLLAPLCRRLEIRKFRPAWAAACAVLFLFFLILAALAVLIPYLASRSFYLLKRIAPAASQMIDAWRLWSQSNVFVQSTLSDAGGVMGTFLSAITGKLARIGMTAATSLGRIGFSLVLTYYVLCERRRIANHLLLLIPTIWRKPVMLGLKACKNAMMSYLSGLLKTSLFVSCATCVGLLLLGVQDAFLLAAFMGIMEVLPYLGPLIASVPILLSALMQGTDTAVLALVMLVLVQQIEGNVISPYFTAASTSIHPLAAIVGVFVFGTLLGFWGILLAVPVLVLIQSISWSWMQAQYTDKEDRMTPKVLCSN